MDKIDMSLDDIIKQKRKDNRKLKKTPTLQNRPSGPGGVKKQAKRPGGQVKGVLQTKGQLKQFRARIGGKKMLGKGVALMKKEGATQRQQQQINVANRGPARKIGKRRFPVKRGNPDVSQNFQQEQSVQQSKMARQQKFNQQRDLQTIPQTFKRGRRQAARINQNDQVAAQPTRQTNRQRINNQWSGKQNNPNRKVPQKGQRANVAATVPQISNRQWKRQQANQNLLTVSFSNPNAATGNFKPVKINRKKTKFQGGGDALSDRFSQFEQQPQQPNFNPSQGRRQKRRPQNKVKVNTNRTVLLV